MIGAFGLVGWKGVNGLDVLCRERGMRGSCELVVRIGSMRGYI